MTTQKTSKFEQDFACVDTIKKINEKIRQGELVVDKVPLDEKKVNND